MAADLGTSESTLSGLDALELAGQTGRAPRTAKIWAAIWPKLLALAIVIVIWQGVVWSGWKPDYLFPGPVTVGKELGHVVQTAHFWSAVGTTLRRALTGFALATVIGAVLGVAVARIRLLRAALGSMITALQTMPSIAWFPLAIMLFGFDESAILLVVVLGAAPAIANGVIAGVDYVPPLLLRAGRNIGARGLSLYRFVIAPASLPAIVAGLKQGWAFAWRSLMAGELLVIIRGRPALGTTLELARGESEYALVMATLVVIFIIGVLVDAAFGAADRAVPGLGGLTDEG